MFTLLKIQASIHVHVHELYSADYRCMGKVCAPCLGQRRVYMYITKMTRTRANFTWLVCTAFLLSVVCYAAQERQKAFRSGSPKNALHCLVSFILLFLGIESFIQCYSELPKGPSPFVGILFQTNDVRLGGGRVGACSFEKKKIGIFGQSTR